MAVPSAKEIWELFKAGATVEAQEKIMELRQAVMVLQETDITQRAEIQSLKTKIQTLEAALDDTPRLPECPSCHKQAWSVAKSERAEGIFGDVGLFERLYECGECGFSENRREK